MALNQQVTVSGDPPMLSVQSFVIILVLGSLIWCALFIVGGWLAESFAKYFRYERYKPDPGHERAAEREERWYPAQSGDHGQHPL